jgi:hypothetical protein
MQGLGFHPQHTSTYTQAAVLDNTYGSEFCKLYLQKQGGWIWLMGFGLLNSVLDKYSW